LGIVLEGGEVKVGDAILVEYPPEPFIKMERV
jgi:MOSC domain-containing protein YiiM